MKVVSIIKWIVLGALFLIPFLALYVANGAFFPFITGKAFAFRILVEIAFVGWAVLALADKQYRPRFSWTLLLYGVFAVWMMVADFLALNPHKAFWSNFERMDGWVTLIHVFMFFVVAGAMLAKESLRQAWWRAFLAAAALTCVVALMQLMGVFAINQGGLRVDATLGNAIYFAVFLMFALGVTLWQAVVSRGWLRYSLYVLAAVEIVFLLFTASRGALIATFGAVVFAALWTAWKSGEKARKLAIGVLVALVVLVGGFFLVRDTSFVTEQPVIARLASVFSISQELQIRFEIWQMAGEAAAERPVFGWGQEGFLYAFNQHYDPSLYGVEPYYDRAHNTYLDWLVAGGVPAFLLFLALLLSTVIALFRYQIAPLERLMLLSLLVAYGIQALVVFDNLFAYIPLAMILATAHIISSKPVKSLESAPELPEQGVGMIAAPAAAALAVALIWIVNVPNMAAATDLIKAQQPTTQGVGQNLELFKQTLAGGSFATEEIRTQLANVAIRIAQEPSLSDATKLEWLTLAISELNLELERAPLDTRLLLARSGVYRVGGDYANSIASINEALEISPKKQQLYLERAAVEWLAGDQDAARASFRTAYELDTSFKDPLIYLAASEVIAGNLPGAQTLLVDTFGTTTVDSDILWGAYANAKQYDALIALQRLRIQNRDGAAADRLMLAKILAVAGLTAEARAEIQATVAAHPEAAADASALLAQISAQP